MFIQFTRDYLTGSGRMFQDGEVIDLDKAWAQQLIADGAATLYVGGDPSYAMMQRDPLTGMTGFSLPSNLFSVLEFDCKNSAAGITASVRNPLAVPSANEPVEIRVMFDKGVCPSAANLYVSGKSIQWEPGIDPRTGSYRGTWSDGSLRAGSIWILDDFSANETKTYAISVGSAQTAGAQNVAYVVESGTVEYFQTPALRTRFASDRAWLPKSLKDPSRSTQELNSILNGLYVRYTLAGVNKFSYTAADVTGVSRQLIGSANFGYGVVFQEWESTFNWAAETGTQVVTRIRQFANNRVSYSSKMTVGATTASDNRGLSFYFDCNDSTTPTFAYSIDNGYASATYASGARLLFGAETWCDQSLAYVPSGHTELVTVAGNTVRLGLAQNPVSFPSGAYFSYSGYFATEYDAAASENLRCTNPIKARATGNTAQDLTLGIRQELSKIASAWIPVEAADTTNYAYAGSMQLARIAVAKHGGLTPPLDEARAGFEAWCAFKSIVPGTAASWTAAWASTGTEYLGPNTVVLDVLRREYLSVGDTVSAAQIATYIHALADFAVASEVTSGGGGQMQITSGGTDNTNAEATAMRWLCSSLAITADSTRLATLTRIAARFVTAYQLGSKIALQVTAGGSIRGCIRSPEGNYHFYAALEALQAHRLYSCLPSQVDYRVFAMQFLSALQIPNDNKYNARWNRRGLPSSCIAGTLLFQASPSVGDYQLAYDIVKRQADKIPNSLQLIQSTLDGFVGTYDGTISGAWGGGGVNSAMWRLLYDLSA